ncbi:Hypothetical_protein [Hexamita inflata]|uniref:Hypothetical_protein n=1 Tax=Hexamita inflata TaxID=28002 RepID=A0AA86TNJ8_9EUKA|nr:Hypothetical protein HINF_LOCUS10468 [Hexamita inflata]CAI9922825.1 Hypothetical protein HINF_LOCUS10470 [Hexamita inflata]
MSNNGGDNNGDIKYIINHIQWYNNEQTHIITFKLLEKIKVIRCAKEFRSRAAQINSEALRLRPASITPSFLKQYIPYLPDCYLIAVLVILYRQDQTIFSSSQQ